MQLRNFLFLLIILSLVFCVSISFYAIDKRFIGKDQESHFYDMKKYYGNKEFPTMGARFVSTDAETSPKVPGGFYYILYILFYSIGGENLFNAKIINLIFNLIILFIFMFWIYKRFGLFIASLMSPIIMINGYLIMAMTDFWNPNVTLMFSLPLFIFLYEYLNKNNNERIIKISAVMIFPVLALMAQGHMVVFFSMVPTLILYLIIRFKRTKKYILFWALGVFISFLLYLPYLLHEIKTGFLNVQYAMNMRGELSSIPFPQVYALILFPTNELSALFGTRTGSIIYYWFTKPVYFYGLIFLAVSIIFSAFAFIRSFVFLLKRKNISNYKEEILKELIFILFLFIPVTIISFIVFRSKSGTFHYLYSAYSISFTPILLFFVQNENRLKNSRKYFNITAILLVLNLFAMSGELIRYWKLFEEPRNYKSFAALLDIIENDSNGENIKIYDSFSGILEGQHKDIFDTYFPNNRLKYSDNAKVTYIIKDNIVEKNWDSNRNANDMKYIIDNNADIVTSTKGFTIYKFYNK
ncbi:hypothetical protein [Brachyspira sp. G79]|uniref:hypothetical protein n=1 Tax=Brachyspira sp. G79 TaxID=1358104 RepID=UPI000BBCDFE9|nr:hypothetical protein [Brachyspira sp. G79]PCG21148.1 hypothetical protein KQ44_00055 [Brachyspira sp. G79]